MEMFKFLKSLTPTVSKLATMAKCLRKCPSTLPCRWEFEKISACMVLKSYSPLSVQNSHVHTLLQTSALLDFGARSVCMNDKKIYTHMYT
jgi:hypothetical protein